MNQAIPPSLIEVLEWLTRTERHKLARELVEAAFGEESSANPVHTDFVAMTLHKNKFYIDALRWAEKTCELLPSSPEAAYNLARCLNSAGRPEAAEKAIALTVRERPEWIDPSLDRAVYICAQGRVEEGLGILETLLAKCLPGDKNRDVIEFNLGWHRIRTGRFKEGMKLLGIGRKLRIWGAFSANYPRPKLIPGINLSDKRVLLVGEGGAGDEIINMRFARTVAERGGNAIWVSHQALGSVFARSPFMSEVREKSLPAADEYDYWAPAMDLPQLLDLELSEIPNEPYLSADPEFLMRWHAKIPDSGRLKVGFRWQGNPLYEQDLYRSVPFQHFLPMLSLPGIEAYSLQRDSGLEEIPPGTSIVDLSSQLLTWEDTAAAISRLDLVITSCTSIAHLAGALGKPTWVYTPINSYYIWASPGDHSPWYPSVRLFRQSAPRLWNTESAQIERELKVLLSNRKSA